jgi:hypothetical protein
MDEKLDSKEELYFKWFVEELLAYEVITGYKYHPKPFLLSPGFDYEVHNKVKPTNKSRVLSLLQDHEYTADFILNWTPKLKGILWEPISSVHYDNLKNFQFLANYNKSLDIFYSVIDIKGSFVGPHNTTGITFPLNQKWVWAMYNVYINKIVTHPRLTKVGNSIPSNALFLKTFVPERFLLTDKDLTPRAIHYRKRTIAQYLIDVLRLE